MSDYRDWCNDCGNEINFGGHKPGCRWVKDQNEAKEEAQRKHREEIDELCALPPDQLLLIAKGVYDEWDRLNIEAYQLQKRWFLYREAMEREGLLGDFLDIKRADNG